MPLSSPLQETTFVQLPPLQETQSFYHNNHFLISHITFLAAFLFILSGFLKRSPFFMSHHACYSLVCFTSSLNKNNGLTPIYPFVCFWNPSASAWPAILAMTTTTTSSPLASQTLMNGWNMPISSADPLTIQVCHVISFYLVAAF